jgi:hypothetical protein
MACSKCGKNKTTAILQSTKTYSDITIGHSATNGMLVNNIPFTALFDYDKLETDIVNVLATHYARFGVYPTFEVLVKYYDNTISKQISEILDTL